MMADIRAAQEASNDAHDMHFPSLPTGPSTGAILPGPVPAHPSPTAMPPPPPPRGGPPRAPQGVGLSSSPTALNPSAPVFAPPSTLSAGAHPVLLPRLL